MPSHYTRYGETCLLTKSVSELENWLINAFNGEWLKTAHPTPVPAHDSGKW